MPDGRATCENLRMQRGAMFLHLFNHRTYHRGCVSQMFFEVGAKPPATDLRST
jgi:uncharacterized damage-inducible protein DinB